MRKLKYGETAVRATQLYLSGGATSPGEAWQKATKEIFPDSKSSQSKCCPRGAYLGLCEAGAIIGIAAGSYCHSEKNKAYALRGLELMMQNPHIKYNNTKLWEEVMARESGENKESNNQMDVVLALWNQGYINYNRDG